MLDSTVHELLASVMSDETSCRDSTKWSTFGHEIACTDTLACGMHKHVSGVWISKLLAPHKRAPKPSSIVEVVAEIHSPYQGDGRFEQCAAHARHVLDFDVDGASAASRTCAASWRGQLVLDGAPAHNTAN